MCGDIIFLIELLKKNKFKNLLIIVQIVISVFYLTFFLIPITEAIDTDILMKKLNMKNDIAFFDEAQHISFLPENYNNDRYEELKNIMKNINNVEEVGSVYTIVGSERNLYGMIIYDQLVYNTIKLDLKEGKWFDNSDIDKEIIPVVISNKLGDTYKINSVFSTNVFLDENMTVKEELTFKVIGILKNKTYVYTGGANHSDCSIADLFIKTTPNDEIVIMPNIFEKMPLYWANNGMIIKTNDYIETYKKMNIDFDGICSGFLGSAKQIEIVKEFFKDFKTEKNFILVDPVMGDHGKLYPTYTREMQEKMRELMPYAAIVTPNLTELCALIDEAYHETSNEQELKRMCEKLSQMGPKMIVVTGISIGHKILNFVYNHGKVEKIYAKRIGEDRSGTGDVISAVIAGSYLKEQNFLEAVKKSTDFASKCIQHSVDIDAHPHMGLCFEPLLKELGD